MALYVHSLHDDLLPDRAPGITCPQSQGDPTSEILHLESHIHGPQGLPLSDPVPGVTFHSLQGDSIQTMHPG